MIDLQYNNAENVMALKNYNGRQPPRIRSDWWNERWEEWEDNFNKMSRKPYRASHTWCDLRTTEWTTADRSWRYCYWWNTARAPCSTPWTRTDSDPNKIFMLSLVKYPFTAHFICCFRFILSYNFVQNIHALTKIIYVMQLLAFTQIARLSLTVTWR